MFDRVLNLPPITSKNLQPLAIFAELLAILLSGFYVTLYMQGCSHYEMRENQQHLSCGFPEAVHIVVKMPRSSCVENCSKNAKSQPNLKFYILPSGKQVRLHWLQAIGRAQQRFKFLQSSLLVVQLPECTVCKRSIFQQFRDKIQSSMHQVFPQIYLTVSIGQSLERPTELFIKKFFFRWNVYLIFLHLNLPPLFILQNKARSHTNLVVNNKFPQHQPSSTRVKSPQARFTNHHK